MNNSFQEMTDDELMNIDGGFVILGITITGAMLVKAGACIIVAGGVGMFAKGCYDGYKGK